MEFNAVSFLKNLKRRWLTYGLLSIQVCLLAFLRAYPFKTYEETATPRLVDTAIPSQPHIVEPLKRVSYSVRRGDTLAKIWMQYGGSISDANKAAEAFRRSGVPVHSLRSGESLEFSISPNSEILEFRKKLDNGRVLELTADDELGFKSYIHAPRIVENERSVTGTILTSFSEAALNVSIPYAVIDDLVDLFSSRVEFGRELQPGDTFTVNYIERRTEHGELLPPGAIKTASIKNSGELLAAISYGESNGKPIYFDESGSAVGNYFLRYPLKFSRISSAFSGARFHPVLKVKRPHNGVDFAAPPGTPVRAVADGTVSIAGYKGGAGLMVQLNHGSRYSTAYLHLSKLAPGVKRGTRVNRGQVIGAVGSTGLATGPHLHYSFFDRGRYVDPLRIKLPSLPPNGEVIPQKILRAALEALGKKHETHQLAINERAGKRA